MDTVEALERRVAALERWQAETAERETVRLGDAVYSSREIAEAVMRELRRGSPKFSPAIPKSELSEAETEELTAAYLNWLSENGMKLSHESRPVVTKENGQICVRGIVPFTLPTGVTLRHRDSPDAPRIEHIEHSGTESGAPDQYRPWWLLKSPRPE
jgi:hypothetical protein